MIKYRFTYFLEENIYEAELSEAITHAFAISLAGVVGVGMLFCWHTYLAATNQTTLEFHINLEQKRIARLSRSSYRNPFDQGNWRRNMSRVFGDMPLLLAILPSLRDPPPPEYPFSYLEYIETQPVASHVV